MFLAPVWDAFPKVDMETGMVPMTQVLHEALGEFTLEQIDRWCLIARWRPEAHVTLSMAELVLGSVETGIRATIFSDASGGSKRSDGWGGVIYFPDGTRREFSGAFDVHEQGFIHCKEAIAALGMLERSGLRDCYVVLCAVWTIWPHYGGVPWVKVLLFSQFGVQNTFTKVCGVAVRK